MNLGVELPAGLVCKAGTEAFLVHLVQQRQERGQLGQAQLRQLLLPALRIHPVLSVSLAIQNGHN